MPVITEVVSAASGGAVTDPPPATLFLAGLTERGSVTAPISVRSPAEAEELLGPRVAYGSITDALLAFFGEGGGRAYVARAVGPAATVGTVTLNDAAATPAASVRFDAENPGAWSSRLTVQVRAGLVAATVDVLVRLDGNLVDSLLGAASPAAIATGFAQSAYVRATAIGTALPAVQGPTALSAGNDDRAAVTATTLVAALDRMPVDLGTGSVAIPGQPHSTVGAGLLAHARGTRRLALLSPPAGASRADAVTAARSLRTTAGSEYGEITWPHVRIPDGTGSVRTVSPEGAVAGLRARTVRALGPGHPPAGENGLLQFVTGVATEITRAESDSLLADAVNAIRRGTNGYQLAGWRSLSANEGLYRSLSVADVVNEVATRGEAALQRYENRIITSLPGTTGGGIFEEAHTDLDAVIAPLQSVLFRKPRTDGSLDEGYTVDLGPSVNTASTIAAGQLRARVGVRPAGVAETIYFYVHAVGVRGELTA